ncbi:uncharacterized protein [Diadema antillarum]|uniref:uncharacterized protein n=1 Tax=Diadema antillarum TaxID=105358 RepID=UPI003A89DA3E
MSAGLVGKDKREYLDNLASEAETTAQIGEQGELYKITKRICGTLRNHGNGPVKDKQSKILTTERQIEERWTEHFKELLNRAIPEETPIIETAENDLDISIEPPSREEIIAVIKTLKNNKAPGGDGLRAELFKVDPQVTATLLKFLFDVIWEEEQVPKDWTKGIIAKIPKKGALNDCNN